MGAPAFVTILRTEEPAQTFTWRSGGYSLGNILICSGVDDLVARDLQYGWEEESPDGIETARQYIGWAESFLIINFHDQSLLWNLNYLDVEEPRFVSQLIEASNPGWQAVWCPYGVDSVWRYLKGDSSATYFDKQRSQDPFVHDAEWFAPFSEATDSFGEDTLFTAVLRNGSPACWISNKGVSQVTQSHIADLMSIAERMPGTTFERYPLWPFNDGEYNNWPQGGVHLDFRARRAWRWSYWGISWDRFSPELWPDWSFVEIGDYF